MAIKLTPKRIPSADEVESVKRIVEQYCEKRWQPYMLFKGTVMLEQGYSVSEVEEHFSKKQS